MELWHVPLRLDPDATAEAARVLDAGERARADRLRAQAHRTAFVAAHAALRHILAEATGRRAEALVFETGPAGKPRLATAQGGGLHFNLSHSGEHALIIVCRERAVGVDVEALPAPSLQAAEMESVFSPDELRALQALPPETRALAVLRCWVRKEALLKGAGCGLSDAVRQLSVSVSAAARLLASGHPDLEAGDWSLLALESPGRWIGAIAARGIEPIAPRWRQWRWQGQAQGLAA